MSQAAGRHQGAVVVAIVVLVACARIAAADEFDADRPDYTNGTALVPRGRAQIELGWTQDRFASGHRDDTFGESLLRVGLGSRAELRLGGPDWNRSRDPGLFESGFGAPGVGAKVVLTPPSRPVSAAVLVEVGLPGGAGSFERDGFDVAGTLAGEWDGEHQGLSANVTLSREGSGADRMWSGALTVSASSDLARRVSGFLEWYEVLDDTDHRPDFVDAGLMWQAAHWTQLDVRAGERIDAGERHTLVGAGISRRF